MLKFFVKFRPFIQRRLNTVFFRNSKIIKFHIIPNKILNQKFLKLYPLLLSTPALLKLAHDHGNKSLINYKTAYDVEKEVSNMIIEAEKLVIKKQNIEAKIVLQKALKICQDNQSYGNIAAVYELLASIAYLEGAIIESENMLVEFIEKLLQIGYPENHNSIVRFKLKLARLYQTVGNSNMAELGYRDCITIQEQKIGKDGNLDETSNILYANAMFWYGRMMMEKQELKKARALFQKTLKRMENSKSFTSSQRIVVLYNNAEVAAGLGDFDSALSYLYKAIDIGTSEEHENPDLPTLVIKVGLVYIMKGLYDNAHYWCNIGRLLSHGRKSEVKEALDCLEEIEKLKNK